MIDPAMASAFPLARPGGVFLLIIGAAIMLGGARFRNRYAILAAGATAATLALAFVALPLSTAFGPPSSFQLASIAVAVLLEFAAIAWAVPRSASRGDRRLTTIILAIVGAHFIVMTPAFGPIIGLLGCANIANAWLGERRPGYRLARLWATDGALKATAGLIMLCGPSVPRLFG